ncbi:hypothetical protein [Spongiimicrobium sp. 3-5]|uniref:hypothetical protein n=1 Tax=Spongiimicrobium sp. 3-5 TaxID=3332596 RepID=UPI0039807E2E
MKTKHFIVLGFIALWCCKRTVKEPERQIGNGTPETVQSRYVQDNMLISNELPEITIKVHETFEYIGNFDFEIVANSDEYEKDIQGKPIASGERFVFAVNEDSVIEKLFIVQFEGFLPSVDFTYNYNFDKAETIGKNKYRQNTWYYDSKKLAEENPANEGALTRSFLKKKGYMVEDEYMMSRFVGLASPDRKYEIIIYYLEMLRKTTGHSLNAWENKLSANQKKTIDSALVSRSRKSFSIEKG